MVAVEWIEPVLYSEHTSTFGINANHPPALALTCKEIAPANTWESWSGGPSHILTLLQGYASYGRYGMTSDIPYLRRGHLGSLVNWDLLSHSGRLSFKVYKMLGVDPTFTYPVLECNAPGSGGVHGMEFAFGLVFWRVPLPSPSPAPGGYDFFKVWLWSGDRDISHENGDDFHIPVNLNTNGAMSEGRWMMAVDQLSPIRHEVDEGSLSRGIAILSHTFNQSTSGNSQMIGYAPRGFKAEDKEYFGYRLTNKPATRDTIGIPVTMPLESLRDIHIKLVAAETGAPIIDAAYLQDFLICLVFYRTH